MKKFASLFLALTMLCSLSVSAFAAHTTTVTYTGTSDESYTLTVPATLAPGASGEVKANGTWASNRTLVVTAPSSVTLTNDIDGGTKTLDVTFDGINQVGNDTVSQTVTKDITVGSIFNALFGTWSGVITYNVSMEDNGTTPAPTLISFTMDGTGYQAEEGMTWIDWVNTSYNTGGIIIKNNMIYNSTYTRMYDTTLPSSIIRAGESYNSSRAGALFATFTIEGAGYSFEEGMTWEDWVNSEYNTDAFDFYEDFVCSSNGPDEAIVDNTELEYVYKSTQIVADRNYEFKAAP